MNGGQPFITLVNTHLLSVNGYIYKWCYKVCEATFVSPWQHHLICSEYCDIQRNLYRILYSERSDRPSVRRTSLSALFEIGLMGSWDFDWNVVVLIFLPVNAFFILGKRYYAALSLVSPECMEGHKEYYGHSPHFRTQLQNVRNRVKWNSLYEITLTDNEPYFFARRSSIIQSAFAFALLVEYCPVHSARSTELTQHLH
jgi:hypothetical protein